MVTEFDKSAGVTELIAAVNAGDRSAYDRLISLIHQELHQLASAQMRRERAGHTLQPTILVNEVYMMLSEGQNWANRAHFFGAAAQAMRRILIDHARKRGAQKRGGDAVHVTLSEIGIDTGPQDAELLALDRAIDALSEVNPRLTQVVELRYFAGLDITETAEVLGVGTATVKRDWRYARAWLYDYMES